jgi:hypothetical protein
VQVTFLLPLGGDPPQTGYRVPERSTRASRCVRICRWVPSRLLIRDCAGRGMRGGEYPMPAWMVFDPSPKIWTDPSKNRMETVCPYPTCRHDA